MAMTNCTKNAKPREISRFVYWFIHHGGMIEGHVASLDKRRSPIAGGGLEIKLKLFFRHTSIAIVAKLRVLISRYEYDHHEGDLMESLNSTDSEDQ